MYKNKKFESVDFYILHVKVNRSFFGRYFQIFQTDSEASDETPSKDREERIYRHT